MGDFYGTGIEIWAGFGPVVITEKEIWNDHEHGLQMPREEIVFTTRPKIQSQILGTVEAYFVCHIGPMFQISLIYAFIGCPH